jgi:hypothetical protein
MLRVLLCDDEEGRATRWARDLKVSLSDGNLFAVDALSPSDFLAAVDGLEQRRLRARESPALSPEAGTVLDEQAPSDGGHPFDSADVLFVDYDLVRLGAVADGPRGSESGERVAYLARCYSRCGIIVVYNQFAYRNTFNLTLRGNVRSFADLNLSSDALSNPGLWGDRYSGFRPWHWPILTSASARFRRRVQRVLDIWSEPILGQLGLTDVQGHELLTTEQLEFLSSSEDPESATFAQFVGNPLGGLRPRDDLWEPQAAARVAAARIAKWIERSVLPGQNILVDAPHLVARFPSLVRQSDNADSWNRACRLAEPVEELGFDQERVQAATFGPGDWLSRPAWVWPRLSGDESIAEVRDPWSTKKAPFVFCEDVSRFRPREDAHEFVAEVSPVFGRRFIQRLESVRYEPAVRLLM